jgi:hypothetical protein
MDPNQVVTLTPIPHPEPRIAQIGFDLSSPYVEQCWSPVIGPSATLLLRRLPVLWRDELPARLPAGELSLSLGLGAGTGPHSRLLHTLDRLGRFGLVGYDPVAATVDVYLQVRGLSDKQLDRLPPVTVRAHDRLLDEHIRQLTGDSRPGPAPTAPSLSSTTRIAPHAREIAR